MVDHSSVSLIRRCDSVSEVVVAVKIRKIAKVVGHTLSFRHAEVSDAEFILALRLDPERARFLSETPPEVGKQAAWLARCSADDSQAYFVILNKVGDRVGVIRLYDQRGNSFSLGSWILKTGVPSSSSIESVLMIYRFGLWLGFDRAHLDVRKNNASVWKFHERFGAIRVGETDQDYLYQVSNVAILKAFEKYKKYLPDGIEVHELSDQ